MSRCFAVLQVDTVDLTLGFVAAKCSGEMEPAVALLEL